MISWLHDSGISGWWKYSAYLSAFLPGELIPRRALARSNEIYILYVTNFQGRQP